MSNGSWSHPKDEPYWLSILGYPVYLARIGLPQQDFFKTYRLLCLVFWRATSDLFVLKCCQNVLLSDFSEEKRRRTNKCTWIEFEENIPREIAYAAGLEMRFMNGNWRENCVCLLYFVWKSHYKVIKINLSSFVFLQLVWVWQKDRVAIAKRLTFSFRFMRSHSKY